MFAALPESVPVQTFVGVPMKSFACANQHTVLLPGKHDPLRGGKYSVQRYGFAEDASIGTSQVPKPTPTNLYALASAVAAAPDGIIRKSRKRRRRTPGVGRTMRDHRASCPWTIRAPTLATAPRSWRQMATKSSSPGSP
jgi:hypothetical protein